MIWLLAQVESVAVPALLEEAKRAASADGNQGNTIYLFVVVLTIGAVGGFFVLRYMLTHAREIHSEANKTLMQISADANKTLLDIMTKHEARCDSLTKAFTGECVALRQVILRTMSDARDMVHATREIAVTAVSGRDLLDKYSKKEDEIKAKHDREQQIGPSQ